MYSYDSLFIGGSWQHPAGPERINVVSPHTEEVIGSVPAASAGDVDAAVRAARTTFDESEWPLLPIDERLEIIRGFTKAYGERLGDFADVITAQMGGPIAFTRAGAPGSLGILLSYLKVAEKFNWSERRVTRAGSEVDVLREPVGVVLAIVPWNAPQFTLMSKLAPALIAGCSVIVKPAPETPLDALMLAEIAESAGLPKGVLSVLPADREVAEALVRHPGIDKVSFTGSTGTGRRIAAICGEQLKRCSLELGGKSAAIVLDDADMAAVVQGVRRSGLSNNGQVCVAQSRIIVTQDRYAETVEALSDLVNNLKIGDPADDATDIGPLVADRQRARVRDYITLAEQEGARRVTGGATAPDGLDRGWYVRPTLFADVNNSMRIAQEEVFGPVLTVIPVRDEAEAIRTANASDDGLSGSVWTADRQRGQQVARRVRTGSFGVNRSSTIDLEAPFGGFKASGIGREFGPEGLGQYVEYKTVISATSGG